MMAHPLVEVRAAGNGDESAQRAYRALEKLRRREVVVCRRDDVMNIARLAEMHLAAWEKTLREFGVTAATIEDRRKAIVRLLEAATREVGDAETRKAS